ncbi:MAG TPA: helix-hairpin-helix domain-containing protein [Flavipsychrobacter sp.]|nr:helix-hairpin-helix domain-containing protein [Flavipsychrobacter sp.]
MKYTAHQLKALTVIPGVGNSIASDLLNIGITHPSELIGKDPEQLYHLSNAFAGCVQDRCLLYVFRCAVYFAETANAEQDRELLKWWNWKDSYSKG